MNFRGLGGIWKQEIAMWMVGPILVRCSHQISKAPDAAADACLSRLEASRSGIRSRQGALRTASEPVPSGIPAYHCVQLQLHQEAQLHAACPPSGEMGSVMAKCQLLNAVCFASSPQDGSIADSNGNHLLTLVMFRLYMHL